MPGMYAPPDRTRDTRAEAGARKQAFDASAGYM
jgi:hypothetical protein